MRQPKEHRMYLKGWIEHRSTNPLHGCAPPTSTPADNGDWALQPPFLTALDQSARWWPRRRGSEVLKSTDTEARDAVSAAALRRAVEDDAPERGRCLRYRPSGRCFKYRPPPWHVPAVRCDVCGRDWERHRENQPVACGHGEQSFRSLCQRRPPLRGACRISSPGVRLRRCRLRKSDLAAVIIQVGSLAPASSALVSMENRIVGMAE
ncbi:hypothetical protein PAHAL_8G224500 [Panicum hallii]|jgi:hypothetical protein|uniref:Uncharacterized protein n=1 Tax=Panicum hallii TaxID=206008 RepID=A0A2S3IFQ0_9POAL|nr:hypothetical protein PAHAL_8G224500 [Panicum hallii]